jgi:PHD finger-like domain-containing protein 5A
VICDSYVRPTEPVRLCDECNYGSSEGRCVVCGGVGVSDAFYCKECVLLEKDVRGARARGPHPACAAPTARARRPAFPPPPQRDGCPKVLNVGQARADWYYNKKQFGFQARTE